jgi:hypothetical protein
MVAWYFEYNYVYFNKQLRFLIKTSDNSILDFSLNNHICVNQGGVIFGENL